MKDINTTDDLTLGTIFKCSWGGMSDYYELIGTTPKTVKLREIRWETCAAPEGAEPSDPVHRWTHICRDENGNTIPEKDWQGYDKIYIKRVINLKDGGITFRSPNYSGQASIEICTNDYTEMYWG